MIYSVEHETYSVGKTKWNGAWTQSKPGNGVTVEGTVQEIRNHSVSDSTSHHYRLQVIVLDVTAARKREFGTDDKEIEEELPKDTLKRKGYLTVHKVEVNDPNRLTMDQLREIIGTSSGALPQGFFDQQLPKLDPHVKGRFEFWGEPDIMKPLDLVSGMKVRLKTKGDSVFVETIARHDVMKAPHYAGENVAGGWGGKIFGAKPDEEEHDDKQGCAEDEWD